MSDDIYDEYINCPELRPMLEPFVNKSDPGSSTFSSSRAGSRGFVPLDDEDDAWSDEEVDDPDVYDPDVEDPTAVSPADPGGWCLESRIRARAPAGPPAPVRNRLTDRSPTA